MKTNEKEWKRMELKGMNQMNQLIKCNINLIEIKSTQHESM